MLKRTFSVFWRLCALALCVLGCIYATRRLSGYYDQPPLVGLIDPAGELAYLDAAALQSGVETAGLRFVQADTALSVNDSANALLAQGASVLVICNDTAASTAAYAHKAIQQGVTLLFVGEPPRQKLTGYDKVWYITNNSAHGGQLLGEAVAMGWREGGATDINSNLLLDYAALTPGDYPESDILLTQSIAECEHYGVYSQELSTLNCDAVDAAAQSFVVWSGQPGAVESAEDYAEDAGVPLAQPEVIFCAGTDAARAAHTTAQALGWFNTDTPTRVGAVLESLAAAKALKRDGTVDFAAYYDGETTTALLTDMCVNAARDRYVAQDCAIQPDDEKTFIIAYKALE